MAGRTIPKWLPYVGYPAFFIFSLLFFIHLTLPYDTIQARLVDEAHKAGFQLTMGRLGPGLFFGVTAKNVSLSADRPTASAADPEAPPSALVLDSVTVRPGLFPPGLHISARAFGGDVDGYVASKPKGVYAVELHGQNLELARAGIKPIVGLDIEGKLKFDADLNLGSLDFSKSTGTVKLSGKDLMINGGTVNYIDLPKASLSALDLKIKADAGKANIETFSITGGDVDAKAEGDITLAQRAASSTVKAKIEFKLADEWLAKNSFVKTGLSLAGHVNSSGYYTATLDGMLLSPRPNLARN